MTHPVAPSSRPAPRAATRPALRAATTVGLTAALAVSGAGSAFAASGHSADARSHGAEHSAKPSAGHSSRPSPEASPRRAHDSRTSAPSSQRRPSTSSHSKAASSSGRRTAAGSAPHRSDDPRGNNGTIKIDGAAYDTRVDNEPHPGCAFRITFFGFDAGQTADITITGIAPTGGGVLLHETAVPTSDDAAGGAGQDLDGATRVYTADDLGLSSVTPHPKQGYHLKVMVDSLEAPGGAKQKVLWLAPCEEQPSATTSGSRRSLAAAGGIALAARTASGTSGGAGGSGTSGAGASAAPATPAPAAAAAADVPGVSAPSTPSQRSAPAGDQVLGASSSRSGSGGVQAQAASALPAVGGTTLTSLAFTGASGVAWLLALGLGAVALGVTLRLAARRRALARI